MASIMLAPKPGPLSNMTRLSRIAFLWSPGPLYSSSENNAPADDRRHPAPKMILVCSWMGATDSSLAKIVNRYQGMFPTAQILLVTSEFLDLCIPSRAMRELEPVIATLRVAFDMKLIPSKASSSSPSSSLSSSSLTSSPPPTLAASSNGAGSLLVHMFSSGGSRMVHYLYMRLAPMGGLPPHVAIYDSMPGVFGYGRIKDAMLASVPRVLRVFFLPIAHAVAFTLWALRQWGRLRGVPDPMVAAAAAHNDRGQNPSELRRAYFYSVADRLIGWKDVERHIAEARRKGFAPRAEKFIKTSHCGHMRAEPDRYWRVVKETWEGGIGPGGNGPGGKGPGGSRPNQNGREYKM